VRQECGDGFSVEVGLDNLDEVVEGGAACLAVGAVFAVARHTLSNKCSGRRNKIELLCT